MKTTKLLIIALALTVMAGSSAFAQTRHFGNHRHFRSHSSVFFNFGLGYPYYGYGYGYPYYGYPYYDGYPYAYGYYSPRMTRGITDDATVAAVQRRLARGGYYHGRIDGVIGPGTRSAIRAFESNNGLPVDGVIDRQLLRTMGLA
jgi:Putative peptidoglycan binding domain